VRAGELPRNCQACTARTDDKDIAFEWGLCREAPGIDKCHRSLSTRRERCIDDGTNLSAPANGKRSATMTQLISSFRFKVPIAAPGMAAVDAVSPIVMVMLAQCYTRGDSMPRRMPAAKVPL
jgi:hypothetical protein